MRTISIKIVINNLREVSKYYTKIKNGKSNTHLITDFQCLLRGRYPIQECLVYRRYVHWSYHIPATQLSGLQGAHD